MPFFQVDGSKITKEETVIERDILGTLRHIFENKLFNIGKTEITLLTITELILIIIAFFLLSRLVRGLLRKRILPHLKLTDSAQFIILRLTHYAMILAGILIGIDLVGIQLTSLTVGVGVVGVGIAFGLQNITSNFVSGIILLFERHVNVGDFVTVDNIVGKVTAINIRSTTVVTPDNTALIVPNSKFIEGTVTNWSVIDPKIRILIPLRVRYKSDLELVSKLLMQSATEHEGVLDDPEPSVIFKAFGDYGLELELSLWILQPDPKIRAKTISELNYAINKLLKENGITIPFPQFNIYNKVEE